MTNMPPEYPVIFEFLPDLKTFYKKWLGKPLEAKNLSFEDKNLDIIKEWKKEIKKEEKK
ncbi:MAG: hypothetical protein ACTSXJ_04195 [Candidatus Baldrarchaeia archaeon]